MHGTGWASRHPREREDQSTKTLDTLSQGGVACVSDYREGPTQHVEHAHAGCGAVRRCCVGGSQRRIIPPVRTASGKDGLHVCRKRADMRKAIPFLLFLLIPSHGIAATITVTSPTSASAWHIGSSYDVRWTHSGFANPASLTVNIRLRRGGLVVCNIASGVPLTLGMYSWPISTTSCPDLSPGTYLVRVRIAPDGEFGDSPQFSVAAGRPHPVVTAIPMRSVSLPLIQAESGMRCHYTLSDGREADIGDSTVRAGDGRTDNTCMRAFLSFDLSALGTLLPAGATVRHALLMLQRGPSVGNPYGELGHFRVVQISWGGRPTSYDIGGSGTGLLDAQCPCREVDVSGIDVTPTFNLLRSAGRSRFQVRLEFATRNNHDGGEDIAAFVSSSSLVVKYY